MSAAPRQPGQGPVPGPTTVTPIWRRESGQRGGRPSARPTSSAASGPAGGARAAGPERGGTGGARRHQNPIDMRQAYLDALSRPQGGGRVVTPGATVPQAQPLGTPSVMDSFLSAHPGGGGQGAGNYSNTGFFDTLNKLRSA